MGTGSKQPPPIDLALVDRAVDRRTTLKWMLSAAATLPVLSLVGCDAGPPAAGGRQAAAEGAGDAWAVPPELDAKGYGKDADLLKDYKPGEVWPLTFDQAQRATAAALSALILPADEDGPGAVEVGVVDFIDEWISAPYSQQRSDRALIVPGLAWIEAEAGRRFGGKGFAALQAAQQAAICDDIRYLPDAKPDFRKPAEFFARYRDLTAGGFCTSPQGRTYLRYVGNTPMARYDGPPKEVLEKVGLA